MSAKRCFDVKGAVTKRTLTKTLVATSLALDWPVRAQKRPEKKLADSSVREVTKNAHENPNPERRPTRPSYTVTVRVVAHDSAN